MKIGGKNIYTHRRREKWGGGGLKHRKSGEELYWCCPTPVG